MKLQNLNLVELNAQEMKETNGGNLGLALAIIGAVIYLYNEGPDFIDGYREGREH